MGRYVQLIFVPLFFFFFVHLVSCQLPANQMSTMNKLYELVQNNNGTGSFAWKTTQKSNPCSWKGVMCNPNNSSITKLSLPLFSLTSEILPDICKIDTLESLDLSNNLLSLFPEGFFTGCGVINGLKLLNFSGNKLVGSLPTFHGFVMLEYLDLSRNCLSGTIDLQLDGLNRLKSLNLSHNKFNGSVPSHLGKSNLLEELQLSTNSFEGIIPQEIASYGNLTLLDVSVNKLYGLVPDRLGELLKLNVLVLSANSLSGGIPQHLFSIQSLWRFAANQNNFEGAIPSGITTYLGNLDLSYNRLNGTIPVDLLSPVNLQHLDLSYNLLEGSIPANMSLNLFRLRLGSNSLSGIIPSSFGVLQYLTYLELDNNRLTGPLPPELGLCQNLALLNLAQNGLGGILPIQLGNLSNLQVLDLQFNNFVGEIPVEITQLHRLLRLKISWNLLSGSIPASISGLQNLTNLDLQNNNLSGSVPASIGNLNSLLELQLGNNKLTGNILSMPQKLQIALNLSYNQFQGPIPQTLSKLTTLEVLDLSNNRFTGEIPNFLTQMPVLTELLLSNNQLSGVVPKFDYSHVVVNATGNKDLVNSTSSLTPTSPKNRNRVAVAVVITVAAAALAGGVVAFVALSVTRRFYRIDDQHLHSRADLRPPQVIQENLLTANGIHRSNIDFVKAMEAVADPSNMIFKTRFSTYYRAVMPSGISYFVKKLNWGDKVFQLGSHEKFREELEVLGKLSNSNVMTPLAYGLTVDSAYLFYEFAQNGTLFDVLHGRLGNVPDWASRYSVAIGVAQGLVFLHGCTSGPIILLDLSSKSIFLKSLKEPQVGDIELCKVIDPSKNTSSLSTIAGSVGYIPPEYAYTMRITMAGNVYSFGVILLELLTGKPAVSQGTELTKLVSNSQARHDKWDQILDFRVSRKSLAIRSQMIAILKVALSCVSCSPEARPKMKNVLRMLLNAR